MNMLRRILLILSVVGLMGSLGLWGLSYWHVIYMDPTNFEDYLWLSSGHLTIGSCQAMSWIQDGWDIGVFSFSDWGFSLPAYWFDSAPMGWGIMLPLWIPTLAFLLTGILMFLPGRRRRRLGLCIGCGYDLRGSPEKCPECGTVPKEPPPAPHAERTTTPGM
jgi:hypothetical protein